MKTDLNQILFETLEDAQKVLNVNDPGYTITMDEQNIAVIKDPAGVVVAEITSDGTDVKQVLYG